MNFTSTFNIGDPKHFERKYCVCMHIIVHFCCNNYMKCIKYETCAKLYTFPAVVDLCCWHAQSMEVDEDSDQSLEIYLCWIRQHRRLLEAFVHMQYLPKSGWRAQILFRPKIKNCVFRVTQPCIIFCPPTLIFLIIFRGFPRDFLVWLYCFPIFPM